MSTVGINSSHKGRSNYRDFFIKNAWLFLKSSNFELEKKSSEKIHQKSCLAPSSQKPGGGRGKSPPTHPRSTTDMSKRQSVRVKRDYQNCDATSITTFVPMCQASHVRQVEQMHFISNLQSVLLFLLWLATALMIKSCILVFI